MACYGPGEGLDKPCASLGDKMAHYLRGHGTAYRTAWEARPTRKNCWPRKRGGRETEDKGWVGYRRLILLPYEGPPYWRTNKAKTRGRRVGLSSVSQLLIAEAFIHMGCHE